MLLIIQNASTENHVLYLIIWIQEIKQLGRSEALNRTHSWKGYSALTTLVRSECNILRQLMLEILLVAGTEITKEVKNVAMEHGRIEAIETMLNWEKGREDKANDARLLLTVSNEEAADWIDQNLPFPPDVENLTGCKPLPPRPTTLPVPSDGIEKGPHRRITWIEEEQEKKPDSVTQQSLQRSSSNAPSSSTPPSISARVPNTSASSSTSRPPPSVPVSFVQRASEPSTAYFSMSLSSTDNPNLAFDLQDTVRLNVAWFPIGFSRFDLSKLFTNNGIACRIILCRSEYEPVYAFVDVQSEDVYRALNLVHKIARSPYEATSHTVLFFHLPLSPVHHHTKTIIATMRGYELIEVVEEKETVLLVHASSWSGVDRLERLWNDYLVDRKRLKVVRLSKGKSIQETVDDYYDRRH
ncbi:hypothetical protein JCM5350_005211 [Sporobolomyces pararoseus]